MVLHGRWILRHYRQNVQLLVVLTTLSFGFAILILIWAHQRSSFLPKETAKLQPKQLIKTLVKDGIPSGGFRYRAPFSPSIYGKTFQMDPATLQKMHFPLDQSELLTLTEDSVQQFAIVSAASAEFYGGLVHAIHDAQNMLPKQDVIVYDLGLSEDQVEELQSTRDVQVKTFDFKKYPKHVEDTYLYAWKPIIIHEVLENYPGVLWMDSSIKFTSSNFTSIFSQAVHQTHGAVMLTSTGHSNYAVTHSAMYHFLPSKVDALKLTQQWEANCMLLYRTHQVYNNVIKWWLLCALTRDCIAPITTRGCMFSPKRDRYKTYADCHRFDQSAINILLANLYDFDDWSYYAKVRVAKVERGR